MDSIGRPVGEDPQDPYKYKVDEIQKDRQAKENSKGSKPEPPQKSAFGAYLLLLFRKMLDLFEDSSQKEAALTTAEKIREDLNRLKAMLEVLKSENRSQDTSFLNQLSSVWHKILEDSIQFQKSTSFSKNYRSFLKKIQHYPEGQEHTLGYYLTEYAGQKWLPFPYMELIQKIHAEHQNDPKGSSLNRWTQEIDELLASLPE